MLSTPPPHFCWVINPCQLTTGHSSCFISGKFFRGQSKISSKWFIALRVWWLVEVLYSLGSDPSFLLKNENDDQIVSCLRRKTRIFSIELWKIHLSSKYANLLGGFCKAFETPFSSSSAEKWLKSLWICETYGYDERRGFFFAKLFMHLFYVFSYFAYFHRSVTLHTGFSILVCANQFFGDPIQCDLVSENTTYFRSNSVIRKANFKWTKNC